MRLPRGWWTLLLGAAALVGLAIWAGPNVGLAIPAATAALVVGGFLLVLAYERKARSPIAPVESEPGISPGVNVREAFASGPMGREDIVLLLDKIERAGPNPTLPVRDADAVAQLTALPANEFRRYVAARLTTLEAET